MSELSATQRRFLNEQRIPLSQVFDATGLSKAQRLPAMESLDKLFFYGGSPCKAEGHTLRSKAGHCIQCDTSRIAFQNRNSQSGYVYIAYSNHGVCAKVGVTCIGPKERVQFLATSGYANCSDWRLIKSVYFPNKAGAIEFKIHALLEEFQRRVVYDKQCGIEVECREVFFTELNIAMGAYDKVVSPTI